jgi:hypothetical protein
MDEIEAALCDVRKAYRLIHLYQRRVLDLCREITGAFKAELNFYYWATSQLDMPPLRASNPVDWWASDFSPLYDFCVLYLPESADDRIHKPNDWMLAVRIAADSGFVLAGETEPDPRGFRKAETCESTVRLYIYYCTQKFHGKWFFDIYQENDLPRDDGEGAFAKRIRTAGMKFAFGNAQRRGGAQLRGEIPTQTPGDLPRSGYLVVAWFRRRRKRSGFRNIDAACT